MGQKASLTPAQGANEAKRVRPGLEPGQPARHEAVPHQLPLKLGWSDEQLPVMQSRRHQGGPLPLLSNSITINLLRRVRLIVSYR